MDQNLRADGTPLENLKHAFPHVDDATLAWAWQTAMHPTYGTINCLALNEKGEMSGVRQPVVWPGKLQDAWGTRRLSALDFMWIRMSVVPQD